MLSCLTVILSLQLAIDFAAKDDQTQAIMAPEKCREDESSAAAEDNPLCKEAGGFIVCEQSQHLLLFVRGSTQIAQPIYLDAQVNAAKLFPSVIFEIYGSASEDESITSTTLAAERSAILEKQLLAHGISAERINILPPQIHSVAAEVGGYSFFASAMRGLLIQAGIGPAPMRIRPALD